ncbi:uncharacterized protein ACBT44_021217 [Syngnathus typhle]
MVKASRPVRKRVRVWPEGASDALRDCFGTTDWEMFKQAATCNNRTDIEEYTDSVSSYITKCIDDVTHTKSIVTRANWKPWLTGAVLRLLRARDKALRAGDEGGLRTARADLSRGIKEAKRAFSCKITAHFKDSRDAQSLWQGILIITDYKPAPQSCEGDIRLLNDLNRFFACLDAQNSTCPLKAPPPPHEQPLCLSADSVRRALAAINTRKAAGPDNIPGRALNDYARELMGVFTDIFNISLQHAIVPSCFKAATIVPVCCMHTCSIFAPLIYYVICLFIIYSTLLFIHCLCLLVFTYCVVYLYVYCVLCLVIVGSPISISLCVLT